MSGTPRALRDPEPLFVYGTLRTGGAAPRVAPWLEGQPRRRAWLFGRLLDLGAYPGALLLPPGAGALLLPPGASGPAPRITGELVDVPRARLPELDRYEGYDPADPCRSLFLRERTRAEVDGGGNVECWVYVYAGGSLAPEIPGGDWLAHLEGRAG